MDAEDFIDQLETAARHQERAEKSLLRTRLQLLAERLGVDDGAGSNLRMLRDTARRLLGGECSKFLLGASAVSERWGPFRRRRAELKARGSGTGMPS